MEEEISPDPRLLRHRRATGHSGADIVNPVDSRPYGMRDFVVRDPDGHRFTLGRGEQRLHEVSPRSNFCAAAAMVLLMAATRGWSAVPASRENPPPHGDNSAGHRTNTATADRTFPDAVYGTGALKPEMLFDLKTGLALVKPNWVTRLGNNLPVGHTNIPVFKLSC